MNIKTIAEKTAESIISELTLLNYIVNLTKEEYHTQKKQLIIDLTIKAINNASCKEFTGVKDKNGNKIYNGSQFYEYFDGIHESQGSRALMTVKWNDKSLTYAVVFEDGEIMENLIEWVDPSTGFVDVELEINR